MRDSYCRLRPRQLSRDRKLELTYNCIIVTYLTQPSRCEATVLANPISNHLANEGTSMLFYKCSMNNTFITLIAGLSTCTNACLFEMWQLYDDCNTPLRLKQQAETSPVS